MQVNDSQGADSLWCPYESVDPPGFHCTAFDVRVKSIAFSTLSPSIVAGGKQFELLFGRSACARASGHLDSVKLSSNPRSISRQCFSQLDLNESNWCFVTQSKVLSS